MASGEQCWLLIFGIFKNHPRGGWLFVFDAVVFSLEKSYHGGTCESVLPSGSLIQIVISLMKMKRLFYSLAASFFLLTALVTTAQAVPCPANYDGSTGVCIPTNTGLSSAPVSGILSNLMSWLLGILGVIGIMAFVISGMQYLLSAGDEKTAETAKTNMKYSIIGIIVALSGFIVIQAVNTALKATSSNF